MVIEITFSAYLVCLADSFGDAAYEQSGPWYIAFYWPRPTDQPRGRDAVCSGGRSHRNSQMNKLQPIRIKPRVKRSSRRSVWLRALTKVSWANVLRSSAFSKNQTMSFMVLGMATTLTGGRRYRGDTRGTSTRGMSSIYEGAKSAHTWATSWRQTGEYLSILPDRV